MWWFACHADLNASEHPSILQENLFLSFEQAAFEMASSDIVSSLYRYLLGPRTFSPMSARLICDAWSAAGQASSP
jgi:hypothetical protein